MKYIFVEGCDDNYLMDKILENKKDIKIIQYSCIKKEKINGLIISIENMNDEYVLLADLDEKNPTTRKREIKKRFKNIDCEKIYFSIQEIEAWYLAGISENHIKKYKIKNNILLNTENITKEKFENLFKNKRDTILEIKLNLLSEFDFEKAKSRNNSFKLFLENAI